MKKVYDDGNVTLIQGDAFEVMATIEAGSIDTLITDPPYFLSNDGFSNRGGKMVSVNKGEWDRDTGDSESFYQKFLEEAKRVLKPNGTIWISGTMHNIYTLGYLLKKNGFKILNNITWQKTNPAPNLSRRMFTHSTETILWAKKQDGKQYFNYDLMREENGGKQMKDVWSTSTTNRSEKRFGKHPTQKPLALLGRMIRASVATDDKTAVILDPFVGSGTTAVAAKLENVKMVGIDNEPAYLEIAKQRVSDYQNERVGRIK